MPKKEKAAPTRYSGWSSRWVNKFFRGSYDHYTCLLPDKIGSFSSLLLKLFYSGIRVDDQQTIIIQQLEENAIVVYVTKFKSFFEYLFYYNRYRQEDLPYPQLGFDYKVNIWQPLSRLLRIFWAKLVFLWRHQSLPDPYDRGYFKQELINGRCGFLSLV